MAAPTITSLAPASGPTAGGTVVTVVGTSLDTVTAVAFGATPASDLALLSATQLVAVAPSGTGTASVVATNPDGDSNGVSYEFSDGLFTVAEATGLRQGPARRPDADFTTTAIIAKEAEIRQWLTRACGVDFIPTVHTDEVVDGYGNSEVMLDWPSLTTLTAASYRSYGTATWTALTSDQLAVCQATTEGLLIWEGGYWPKGSRTVKVTYTAGYVTVPALIKRAALRVAVMELPAQNAPWTADGYDAGGSSFSFTRGDGFNGAWSSDPDVMRAIRMYDRHLPGIT